MLRHVQIYEAASYAEIWNDARSGAHKDVSIWRPARPSAYYSLGDVAWASHGQPTFSTLIVKAWSDEAALAGPTDFHLVWKDTGSGARWDVSFWQPVCPPGYRALGHLAVRSHSRPALPNDDIRCLKDKYTEKGGSVGSFLCFGSLEFWRSTVVSRQFDESGSRYVSVRELRYLRLRSKLRISALQLSTSCNL